MPDGLWAQVEAILAKHDPAMPMGRKRIDRRRALDGIIFRLSSGVRWNHLPREFGDDSSVHRTRQRWAKLKVFDKITPVLGAECEQLADVDWEW